MRGPAPPKIDSENFDVKVGVFHFEEATNNQEAFFSEIQREYKPQFSYEVTDSVTAFEPILDNFESQLLYFFSHGRTVKLGSHNANPLLDTHIRLAEGILTLYDLRTTMNLPSRPLVFLNMCESAQLYPEISEGLIDVFLKKGACAVIGTEIPMLPSFADLFSREVLGRIFHHQDSDTKPMSVGQALYEVRRNFLEKNNPLGFAYTIFGDTSIRLSQSLYATQ